MNEKGICNGLAMVHAKYVLEGKEEMFMDLVDCIGNGIPEDQSMGILTPAGNKITANTIDFFIMEVFLAFNPSTFERKLSQASAMNVLQIEGANLKSSFDFAMVGSKNHWENVIADLRLQKGEVLQVASVNHAISVHYIDNKYRVYDPNYSSGYKDFSNEKQLIRELHHNVFDSENENLGLRIHVIRHPEQEQQERIYPSITELYKKYLPDVDAQVTVKGKVHTTLTMTANHIPNSDAIKYLLNKEAKHVNTGALNAVMNNNPQALKVLLDEINEDSVKENLFKKALYGGRQEVFDELVKHENLGEFYQKKLVTLDLVIWAAAGGNPDLLTICIEKLKTQMLNNITNSPSYQEKMNGRDPEIRKILNTMLETEVNKTFTESLVKKDVMAYAVLSGDSRCIKLVSQELAASGKPLQTADRIHHLSSAIRRNHHQAAVELMDMPPKLEPEALQTIQMSVLATSRTNLLLLHDLRDRGVLFSERANQVIAKKEHQALGILTQLGIIISKYTDFAKEYLSNSKEKGVSVNLASTSNMKNRLQAIEQKSSNVGNIDAEENRDSESSAKIL